LKKPLFAFSLFFIVSIYLANITGPKAATALAAAAFVCFVCFAFFKGIKSKWAVLSLGVFTAFLEFALFFNFIYTPILNLTDEEYTFRGTLVQEPQELKHNASYIVRVEQVQSKYTYKKVNFKINVYSDKSLISASVGDKVEFFGKAKIPEKDESLLYNRSKGIYLVFYDNDNLLKVISSPKKGFSYIASEINRFSNRVLSGKLSGEAKTLALGILLGDKSNMTPAQKELFSKTGVSHAFAVSGMHIGFLTGFLTFIFMAMGIPRRVSSVLTIVFILMFMAVIGFTPSVIRAGIMAVITLAGIAINKMSDSQTSLGIAGIIICAFNPFGVCDLGFQLSFLSVLGILTVSGKISKAVLSFFDFLHMPKVLSKTLSLPFGVSLAATLFTLPVIGYEFKGFALLSPVVNILILWAVEGVFILSVLLVIFGGLAFVSNIITILINGLSVYIMTVIKLASQVPFSYISLTYSFIPIIILFIVLSVVLYVIFKNKGAKIYTPVLALIFLTVISFATFKPAGRNRGELVFTAVDVGQGDAFVLLYEGRAAVFDCGSTSISNPAARVSEYLKKNLINKIDSIFISHFHEDHVSGVDDLMELMPVDRIYAGRDLEFTESGRVVKNTALKNSTEIIMVEGDIEIELFDKVKVKLFADHTIGEIRDNNELSIVALIDYKDSEILVTGDLIKKHEKLLINKGIEADLLKVAHHGSSSSSSLEFLSAVKPSVAVISYGENKFNLPNYETLKRLEFFTDRIYTTYKNKNIQFFTKGDGVFLINYGG